MSEREGGDKFYRWRMENDNNGKNAFFFLFKGMQPPSVRHSRLKATARAEVFALQYM